MATETQDVVVSLPREVADSLAVPASELSAWMRAELAVHLFRDGRLTSGQARALAGVDRWSFLDLLRRQQVPIRYGVKDLADDLEGLARVST